MGVPPGRMKKGYSMSAITVSDNHESITQKAVTFFTVRNALFSILGVLVSLVLVFSIASAITALQDRNRAEAVVAANK